MLKFHSLRVAEVQPDAEDAVAVALDVPAELQPEYVGLPGQHVVLRAFLEGEEERRTYSLINAPGEWPMRIVARVHKYGRMSRHIAQDVKVGDRIDVLPPNGSLTPRLPIDSRAARTYVGLAAGCGITPVLSVVKAILRDDTRSQFILLYGNTSTGRVMCMEELLGLKDRYLDRLALHFVMSREPQEVELYNGRIDAARVREVAGTLFEPDQVAEYFVCGPGDMIQQVSGVLRELGVGAERIHGEHFTVDAEQGGTERAAGAAGYEPSAAGHGTSAVREAASRPSDAVEMDAVEVTVLIDGRRRTFTMKRNDDTILDAATRAGLELPYSCRAGVCSTCRTKVVSGEVAMDQNYALEDWELEQGYVLACQSRVKTPTLELDYDEK
jgi:ring-1,2-phenylacetyl-CoA epoxidase subunit PaaE